MHASTDAMVNTRNGRCFSMTRASNPSAVRTLNTVPLARGGVCGISVRLITTISSEATRVTQNWPVVVSHFI